MLSFRTISTMVRHVWRARYSTDKTNQILLINEKGQQVHIVGFARGEVCYNTLLK